MAAASLCEDVVTRYVSMSAYKMHLHFSVSRPRFGPISWTARRSTAPASQMLHRYISVFFLRRPGTGHICNSQIIRNIQNTGIATLSQKQGTSDTCFSHSIDNQYIVKHPRSRSPQKILPTSSILST